jgi:hypothetical protein
MEVKKLLALVHELESWFFPGCIRWVTSHSSFRNYALTPVVVVFTKYDLLVCSKYLEEEEE